MAHLGTPTASAQVAERVLPGYGKQENFVLIGLSKSDTITSLGR